MGDSMVKEKLQILHNLNNRLASSWLAVLIGFALLTFIFSLVGAFPQAAVESWYARVAFPKISVFFGVLSDAVPFSWLDIWIVAGLALVIWSIYRRRFRPIAGAVAIGYLVFFWSWGLNYHRTPLALRLTLSADSANAQVVEQFARNVAAEINRIYAVISRRGYDEAQIRAETERRVRRVIAVIDGSDWNASNHLKTSLLANPWFRVASIDGVFNPLGHEPIITNGLLEIERPFVMAHELAHVRGYPDEGDANLIAVLATVVSEDTFVQYSGWLHLWLYVRNRQIDELLDEGPRRDHQLILDRLRSQRIQWISNLQATILDWYLKANNVEEGVRSYSRIVVLAVRTQPFWERYR